MECSAMNLNLLCSTKHSLETDALFADLVQTAKMAFANNFLGGLTDSCNGTNMLSLETAFIVLRFENRSGTVDL